MADFCGFLGVFMVGGAFFWCFFVAGWVSLCLSGMGAPYSLVARVIYYELVVFICFCFIKCAGKGLI